MIRTYKILSVLVLVIAVVIMVNIVFFSVRNSGPDWVSKEIAEKLIFTKRKGVLHYQNNNPQSWNAIIILSNKETFQVSYIDQEITDKGKTFRWREMNYILNLSNDIQISVSDQDMDGVVDTYSINRRIVYHTEPGYETIRPENQEKAQKMFDAMRMWALEAARASDEDITKLREIHPPGKEL